MGELCGLFRYSQERVRHIEFFSLQTYLGFAEE